MGILTANLSFTHPTFSIFPVCIRLANSFKSTKLGCEVVNGHPFAGAAADHKYTIVCLYVFSLVALHFGQCRFSVSGLACSIRYKIVTVKIKLSPMHVAIFHNILWSKYKGGVFTAIHRIAPQYGIEFSFCQIAETEGERIALGGVDLRYHRYPFELLFKGSYYNTSLFQRLRSLILQAWQTKADIVILPGYERPEYWAMLFVLFLRGKPRAVFCDSTGLDHPRSVLKGLAKRLFFSRCNAFFAYGVRSKEYLMSYSVPADRIFFRCQAAALPPNYSESMAVRARLAAAPRGAQAPRFLYVGRLSSEKGLDTLLKAMQIVRQASPGARLTLVGAGPLESELRAMTESLGLDDVVTLPGSMDVEKLAGEYARATALVLPSTSEPWGLVVNESLSMGCPVVVSNRCGCVPELVVEGQTGYEFPAGDATRLADCMLTAAQSMSDVEHVAVRCVEHVRPFSPTNAAIQIIQGCRFILLMLGNA